MANFPAENALQTEFELTSIGDRVWFEHLLSNIMVRFEDLPTEGVAFAIEASLREILDFFQADQIAFYQHRKNSSTFEPLSYAVRPGKSSLHYLPGTVIPGKSFSYTFNKVFKESGILAFSRADEMPDDADTKENWVSMGIKSLLFFKAFSSETFHYAIGISSIDHETSWPEIYIPRLKRLVEIFANAMENHRLRMELLEQMKFDGLLSNLSAKFLNLPPHQMDAAIEHELIEIIDFLHIERTTVAQLAKGSSQLIATHQKLATGVQREWQQINRDMIPWIYRHIVQGETVEISFLNDLPEEASRDREVLSDLGIKSCIVYPLKTAGCLLGMMSFSTLQAERVWPGELVQKLKLVSDLIANALERKHLFYDLRSAEKKIQDLLAFAYDWEYWENHDRTLRQMSPSCVRVTGYDEGEFLKNPALIEQIIHPEDLPSWEVLFHKPDAHPKGFEIQIRVCHRNGEIRWINHSRRPLLNDHGALSGFHVRNRDVTEHKQKENKLQEQQGEIQRLTKQLKKESSVFIQEYALQFVHEEIIGRSHVMKEVLAKVEQVARTDSTVLIQGETGTGKELLAGAIHKLSMRKDKPMITVNCACLPPTLMESELFGREKGAYTGALTRMVGRFELADHSTIFLDEIGELPLDLQSKLLRVLQEGRFERLGSGKTQKVDVRIIAATNRNLEQMVKEGLFRKDLYYRLKVFPIDLPALRDRSEDIPLLVWAMVKELEPKIGKSIDSIPPKTLEALERYTWPGNVRELRNVIEYGMIISKNNTLTVNLPHLDGSPQPAPDNKLLEDIERMHVLGVLEKTGWRISGPTGAAEILGIKRTTLQSKIKKLGIKRPGS